MTNSLLQIKIKQRLNKLASLDYDNIECWQVTETNLFYTEAIL